MFEQKIESISSIVFIEERDCAIADSHGVTLFSGWKKLTVCQAVDLVVALDKRIKGGFTYKKIENRMKAIRGSIANAFGPELETMIPIAKRFMPVPPAAQEGGGE
jgi:hypothetical protein